MYVSKKEQEYKSLLSSGMFYEFYPELTGDWIKDKDVWKVEYSKLQKLRRRFNKSNSETIESNLSEFLKWKQKMDNSLDSVFDIK